MTTNYFKARGRAFFFDDHDPRTLALAWDRATSHARGLSGTRRAPVSVWRACATPGPWDAALLVGASNPERWS